MADYTLLKAAIQQVIKTNGNQEITGLLLQQTLLSLINELNLTKQDKINFVAQAVSRFLREDGTFQEIPAQWDGGSAGLNAATGRESLGLRIGIDVLAYRTFGTAANNNTEDFLAFNGTAVDSSKLGGYAASEYQRTIAAGTTLDYYRGDKTWQALNTSVVPELTNLYFTDARSRSTVIDTLTLTNAAILSTDSFQTAFGKAQAQINNRAMLNGSLIQDFSVKSLNLDTTILYKADADFLKTLQSLFYYDSANDSIRALKNFYSVSGVSAYGIGPGGGGGGGVVVIDNLTSTLTNAALSANQGRILKGYIDLKQPQLNGTGLVRMSGTGVTYDNTSYATVSQLSGYALLAGSISQAFNTASLLVNNDLTINGANLRLDGSTNKTIRLYSATHWYYHIKTASDDFYISDAQGYEYLRFYYNGGTKYTKIGNVAITGGAISGATTGSFSGEVSAASFISGGNAVLHAGNYSSYALPLYGGTLSGGLTLSHGRDLSLKAPEGSLDSGDLVFLDGDGIELHRLWSGSGTLNYRASGGTTRQLYHTGNLTNTLSSGYLPYWNGSSLVNSVVYTNGTNIAIGLNNAYARLTLKGGIGDGFRMTYASSISAAASLMLDATENPYWSMVRASDGVETISLKSHGNSFFLGGNVGIGITNPISKFQVAQDVSYSQSTSGQLRVGSASGIKRLMLGYDTTKNFAFLEAVNEGVSYSAIALNPFAGNVYIGYTQDSVPASYRLAVNGTGYFNGNLSNLGHFSVKGVGNYIWFDTLGAEGSTYMGTVNNYDFRIANSRGKGCTLDLRSDGVAALTGGFTATSHMSTSTYFNAYGTDELKFYYTRTGVSTTWAIGADGNSTYFKNVTDAIIPLMMYNNGRVSVGTNYTNNNYNFQVNGTSYLTGSVDFGGTGYLSGVFRPANTNTRRGGMYGVYDYTRVGHIWSMGESFQIPNDGSGFGNLYGLAYKYENYGGVNSRIGAKHMMVLVNNGIVGLELGFEGGIWSSDYIVSASYLKGTSIKIGANWEAIPNGNDLELRYGGVMKAKLSSSGDILATGGVTAFAV